MLEVTFHFLCNSSVSSISCISNEVPKKVLFPNNLSLKFFKSEKALPMTQRNTVPCLLFGIERVNAVFVIPTGKKGDYHFLTPLNASIAEQKAFFQAA